MGERKALVAGKLRRSQWGGWCCVCLSVIEPGERYFDHGSSRKAHHDCACRAENDPTIEHSRKESEAAFEELCRKNARESMGAMHEPGGDEFAAAWSKMEQRGYQYGPEALSNVRVGWDMALEQIAARDARIEELEARLAFACENPCGNCGPCVRSFSEALRIHREKKQRGERDDEPCDHPSHRNPGLLTPCPQCGERRDDG